MAAEIDRRLKLQAEGRMAPWAVVSRSSGRAVGMTTYMNIDAPNRRVEIGSTWIGRDAQGTGVNPAAKLLLLARAFEELNCIAVEFRTHWHNGQSRAAIAKLGAKQDGVLRNHQVWKRRNVARHRRVFDHRQRMAGRETGPLGSTRGRPRTPGA